MTDPIYDYSHQSGCRAITGGGFVPNRLWPVAYDRTYLFSDYVCGKILVLRPKTTGGFSASDFVTGLGEGSAVSMRFGPHEDTQALYYTTYGNGGEVRRIVFSGTANRTPRAVLRARPKFGPVPLTVKFYGGGSSDPDGDPLTYRWSFGDGTSATGRSVSHTYQRAGIFTATLTVRDGRGGNDAATVTIGAGHTPPTPTILQPTPTTRFRVGQRITLQGSATDEQGQALPPESLTWTVTLHHDTHTHPFLPPTSGNDVEITAPEPESLEAAAMSYLEIRLKATDTRGLSRTIRQDLLPTRVALTFASDPTGLTLRANGQSFSAPRTVVSWEAYEIDLEAPTQTDPSGRTYVCLTWSDGGLCSRTIATPAGAASYTANFVGTP